MADIFLSLEASKLLNNKRILLFGDSNMRAAYKDLVWLLQHNTITGKRSFEKKLEKSFANDCLVSSSELHKGRSYQEVREYKRQTGGKLFVRYTFITRCYQNTITNVMEKVKKGEEPAPDVIIINSCLWDVSRWGPQGVSEYRVNMDRLMKLFKECLTPSCRVVWTTTLPLSFFPRGGFLVKQVDFLRSVMPYEVMEGNLFARQVVGSYGYDVLDIHFHVRMQIHMRAPDGVHWQSLAIRHITNVILTHLCLSFGQPLPGRARQYALQRIAEVETVIVPTEEKSTPPDDQAANMAKKNLSQTQHPKPELQLQQKPKPGPGPGHPKVRGRRSRNRSRHSHRGRYNYEPRGNSYYEPPRQDRYRGPDRRGHNSHNNHGYPY